MLVGLGNPGREYADTRHNIGFMVIDHLAQQEDVRLAKTSTTYISGTGNIAGRSVVLAKPLTYMNRSGLAVLRMVERYAVPLDRLLVILDDFNLPFGRLRIRAKGSDGGHNGLASIIDFLSSSAFPRLRIGIGNDTLSDAVEFVLSPFEPEEQRRLPELIDHASDACRSFVEHGIQRTMNIFNQN